MSQFAHLQQASLLSRAARHPAYAMFHLAPAWREAEALCEGIRVA